MASEQQQQQQAGAPPKLVGNAFVHQYYHILHHSPELVHRFYQDVSKLGRLDAAGSLSTITTMQAINEKILSLEYSEYKSEIKTVDAQESYGNGVLVLVTGYLTGKDNVQRSFTQSFFLAPQDKGGYFVLNDIFRYVGEGDQEQQQPENQVSIHGPEVPPSREDEFLEPHEDEVPEQTASPAEGEETNGEVIDNPSENDEGSVVDEEAPTSEVVDEVQDNSQAVVDPSPAPVLEEAPKKSYASIVKVMKENAAASSFPAASPARPAPVNPQRQASTVTTSSSAPEVPASASHGADSGDVQEAEADGHSIYIKNLPLNATVAQLEEEFKRFGTIKPDGIQVRSNKQQGFCFGFVEFDVATAVQSAIEASPITIGGRQAYIEEKRHSGSRVSNRGRFALGRGGFRGDGMRGRGSYGGGRGYGRGDFNIRSEFPNRGGGRSGTSARGDGGYQRVDHPGNNGGRSNRATGLAVNASSKNVAPRVPAPA